MGHRQHAAAVARRARRAEQQELLLRLFKLLLDNVSQLLDDDSWLRGQVDAVQNLIAGRNAHATEVPAPAAAVVAGPAPMTGAKCPECGAYAMIRKDGCDYCTQCGHLGACG